IDTSVLLSQNTVEQLFGPDSDASEPDLSQNAVARAFELSQRDLRADEEHRDAAVSLQLLSEASGLESEGEDERAVAPSATPPTRTRNQPIPNTDVNLLQKEENSSDYEDLSSGDESEGDGIFDDDGDAGVDVYDGDGDELSDSDAEEMDQVFLASLHVGDTSLSKEALVERENTLRTMKWAPASAEFETDAPSYPGLGAQEAKPVAELLDVWTNVQKRWLHGREDVTVRLWHKSRVG
ncbi:hypothetical protein PHPALM_30152, partial [Phytophthora palmivora]